MIYETKKVKVAFGCILRMYRESKNIKQDKLADMVGLSRTSVVNIEQGKQGVSLCQTLNLCHALEIKPKNLLNTIAELCKP